MGGSSPDQKKVEPTKIGLEEDRSGRNRRQSQFIRWSGQLYSQSSMKASVVQGGRVLDMFQQHTSGPLFWSVASVNGSLVQGTALVPGREEKTLVLTLILLPRRFPSGCAMHGRKGLVGCCDAGRAACCDSSNKWNGHYRLAYLLAK